MDHDVLKSVIFDRQSVIENARDARIIPRAYTFDPAANYVVTGLRRAGKSTLLYKRALDLVESGVGWERIICVDFEDERLADFGVGDFSDILKVQAELSAKRGFFFFDEIQNVPGWEKFARRLADSGERVYITGSNAKMISSEMETTLGGRFLSMHVDTFSFEEFLRAVGQKHDERTLLSTKGSGAISGQFERYFTIGGFPEAIRYAFPREYVASVYQKVLLGDIVARNGIRTPEALRVLIKKIAETVGSEVSYTTLHGMLKAMGFSTSKDTVIEYIGYAKQAYLLFDVKSAYDKFAERESNPRYYFCDNGLLNLFLTNGGAALLENAVALGLKRAYGSEAFFYAKSRKTGVDVDFYVPSEGMAIQVAYSISGSARKREINELVKLAAAQTEIKRAIIVTRDESETIEANGVTIEVMPAYRFLLELESEK